MATCTTCGAALPAGARFCSACGAPAAEAPVREARKTVTLLFCDVSGSTALGERLDPEVLRRALRRYFEEIESVIVAHGGLVEKFVGDAVMAVFGLPAAHEDDALRAVRAALEVHERLPRLAEETGLALVFRTGLNTGEVVTGEGQTLATGDAVNVAARLQQTAAPGEILVGAATERLVRGRVDTELLATLRVHGRDEPVTAFRLRGLAAESPPRAAPPFVGRARELRLLHDAFERTVAARELHLFTVLGPAGIGKSRLAGELLASLGSGPAVAAGRCLSYGRGITFWPLVEILDQLGEEGREVRRRVLEGSASSPDELAWAVRTFLERVADERPLVLLVDDLHWAEPTLLDLLDRIVELSRGAPILLLCLARPELLEERPGWSGGRLNATTMLLDGLPGPEAERLIATVPEAERARLVDVAGGNPLFLEELAAERAETGAPQSTPLIQALLQARLDRLPPSERELLGCASVAGLSFRRDAVAALVCEVDVPLRSLTVKDLVRPLRDGRGYAFRHELICDAAYAELPKSERARIHQAFAEWLDLHAETLVEREEIVAHHLEQAALTRRELGVPDRELEQCAALRLAEAAASARRRTDLRAAADLWTRALSLLEEDDPRRPPIEVELAFTAAMMGDQERSERLLDLAERRGDDVCVARAHVARLRGFTAFQPDRARAAVERERERSLPVLERAGDHVALAQFWGAVALTDWLEARPVTAGEALARQLEHARAAGDRALEAGAETCRLYFLAAGRDPWAERLHDWERLRERFPGEPQVEVGALLCATQIALHDGRFDDARSLGAQVVAADRRMGDDLHALFVEADILVEIERLAGNHEEAVRRERQAIEELRRRGERGFLSTMLVNLARLLLEEGSPSEAAGATREAESLGARDDRVTQAGARAVRARALLRLGALDEAEATAREAVAIAAASEMLPLQADCALTLGEVLSGTGDEAGGRRSLERAIDLYERKGLALYAEQARRLLSVHA